jgi:hypothetical protein
MIKRKPRLSIHPEPEGDQTLLSGPCWGYGRPFSFGLLGSKKRGIAATPAQPPGAARAVALDNHASHTVQTTRRSGRGHSPWLLFMSYPLTTPIRFFIRSSLSSRIAACALYLRFKLSRLARRLPTASPRSNARCSSHRITDGTWYSGRGPDRSTGIPRFSRFRMVRGAHSSNLATAA